MSLWPSRIGWRRCTAGRRPMRSSISMSTISQFGSNPEWLLVAEEAGAVQGALLASDRGRDGSLLISSFGVFPKYQRKGVGTALLAEAELRARQRGKVRLLVGAAADTEPFYSEVRLHTTALYRDHWRRKRRHVGILARRSPGSVQRPVVRHGRAAQQGDPRRTRASAQAKAIAGTGHPRTSHPASLHERVLNGSALARSTPPHYAPDRGCRPAGHQPA